MISMEVHATKKLLDTIPFLAVIDPLEEENPLFSWHANIVMINRRKTVILMNDHNRYIVVLYGLKAKDFKKFDELIIEGIRQTLKADRIPIPVIDRYLAEAGRISFYKTKNRSLVSSLNRACDAAWSWSEDMDLNTIIQAEVGKAISRLLVGGANIPYITPFEEMRKDLMERSTEDAVNNKAAIMHISLKLENDSVWRRVRVPLDFSFTDFHKTIQVSFSWQNAHLYSFHLYKEAPGENEKPALNIGLEDAYENNEKVDQINQIDFLLAGYIPPYEHMKYIYDFGDNWEHTIVVEEIVDNQTERAPVCKEGEGVAPPEDCGGAGGYTELLKVLNDPTHPEHAIMKDWASGQSYEEFNINIVNYQLRMI